MGYYNTQPAKIHVDGKEVPNDGRILSDDEVKDLLEKLSKGSSRDLTEEELKEFEEEKNKPIKWDLLNNTRVIQGRYPLLELTLDMFSRIVFNKLNQENSRITAISPISIDMTTLGNLIRAYTISDKDKRKNRKRLLFKIEPLLGDCILVIDKTIWQDAYDYNKFGELAIASFGEAWAKCISPTLGTVQKSEWLNDLEEIIDIQYHEQCLIINYEVEYEGNSHGSMEIILPCKSIGNKILKMLGREDSYLCQDIPNQMLNKIKDTKVELKVMFEHVDIPIKDALTISAGNTLVFERDPELYLVVNGTKIYECQEVDTEENKTIRILGD